MGKLFKYINDNCLIQSEEGDCHYCKRPNVPSFDYNGVILNAEHAANPDLARSDPDIFAACADCIDSGNIAKHNYELNEIRRCFRHLSGHVDVESAVERYNLIPHIPLMLQNDDWPFCCDEWCEFHGNPSTESNIKSLLEEHEDWDFGPSDFQYADSLTPESLREISLFRCFDCGKSYFIWQST
ncbi:MAG: CbrC family protein [Rubripirellula sp.]